jgi:hypothetical protein
MIISAPSFKHQRDIISAESLSAQKENKSVSTKGLPLFMTTFVDHIKEVFEDFTHITQGLVNPNSYDRLLKKTSYAVLLDIELFKPEGMVGSYSETLDVLERWESDILDVKERLIDPLSKRLAVLLTDPSKLSKLTSFDIASANKDSLLEDLATVIDSNDVSTVAKYTDLVKSNSEWKDVIKRSNTLLENFNRIDVKDLKKSIKTLVEMIDTLSERIKKDPETYKVSGSVLKEIVEAVYTVSEEVELFGLYGYRLKTVVSSIEANERRLKDIVKSV